MSYPNAVPYAIILKMVNHSVSDQGILKVIVVGAFQKYKSRASCSQGCPHK